MWFYVFGVLSFFWHALFILSVLGGDADHNFLVLGFLHMIVAKQWRDD